MITKERLEELIEQEATIWGIGRYPFQDEIEEIELDRDLFCVEYNALLYPDLFCVRLEDLFETKKRAEWYLKYHATRTEELDLPMWDEVEKGIEYNVYAPKGCIYRLKTKIKTGYSCDKENPYIIRIEKVGYTNSQHDFEFNEENYTKACDLCLKLFEGEENGNLS